MSIAALATKNLSPVGFICWGVSSACLYLQFLKRYQKTAKLTPMVRFQTEPTGSAECPKLTPMGAVRKPHLPGVKCG